MDVDEVTRGLEETVGLMLVKHLSPVYVNQAITALRELQGERNAALRDMVRLEKKSAEAVAQLVVAESERDALKADNERLLELLQRCRPLVQEESIRRVVNFEPIEELLRDVDAEIAARGE